jgi:DNA polymerase III alpha subunit
MAAEKHDALKIMKIVPDIAFSRDIARTKSKEDVRARTETVMIATTAANTLIASSGCRAIQVEVNAATTTTMEIDAGKTTVDDNETRENASIVLGTLPRNQVTRDYLVIFVIFLI